MLCAVLVITALAVTIDPGDVRVRVDFFNRLLSAGIWIPYFCFSKRIKATFVN